MCLKCDHHNHHHKHHHSHHHHQHPMVIINGIVSNDNQFALSKANQNQTKTPNNMDRIKYKRSKLSQSIIPDMMKNIPYPDTNQHNDRSSLLLLRIVSTLNITTTTTVNHNHNHNHNINIKSFLINNIIMNSLLSLLLMLICGSIFNQITIRTTVRAMDEFVLDDDVLKKMVGTFGRELSMVGIEQTCLGKIEENFQRYSQEVQWFDGNKMMDDMRNDVMYMFNWKKHSVERIANESERLASNHTYDKNIEIDYHNVKDLDKDGLPLQQNANFDDAFVNMEHSAIHVPVNVYDRSPDVVNDIKWSEHLTQFFRNNLAFDPSLSWQFFGSAKGFLRIYPATKWREPRKLTDKPLIDFYDCRFRPWYIKGAASPKDVVILLDTSGSMTGVRKSIGRSVLEYILNTLTDDDYVAALKFSKEPVPISPCLDTLVQANKKNIDEIKNGLAEVKTNEFVNFTAALVEAFTFLQKFNRSGQGSQCNQAIMLITDGAPGTYEEVFRQFNWPNIPVRVFTYLIGQDANSHVEVYWMACHNRGYYAHVMNRAEVHEQVQKYIPVMSRPIVLSGERVFSWTSIYAPTYELELNPVNWRNKQKYEITNRLRAQARLATASDEELPDLIKQEDQDDEIGNEQVTDDEDDVDDDDFDQKRKRRKIRSENPSENGDDILSIPFRQIPLRDKKPKKISLYTTLSTPVFDTRNYTNITKRILIKNVYQDADIETIRIANLLGVAGVDIPIKEIEKLTPPFKLGVNGYSFMITNNGYLLNHPDLRPTFEGFLKPFYNSVDMSEVEIANNTLGPRELDPVITSIRGNMINRTHGWKKVAVKVHIDDMKRVITRVNHYTHGMIGQTPFSLAIALPEPYGSYRLTSQVDLRMKHREENFTKYFRGNQWRVHPEWAYCDNPHLITGMPQHAFSSPEESILQFLENDLQKQNFRWRTSSIRPKVSETILCDKDLVQSLVLDANLTDIPGERCISNPNYRDEQRIKTFGIVTTFVATRSGLTRFKDYRSDAEIKSLDDLPFYLKYDRAIEEIYYKRSVDFYTINKDAFVYFVDYDAGEKHERRMAHTHSRNDSNFLITATHALFIGNLKHSTPVAVVGIQFRYETLHEFFLNITNKFNVPCTHLDVDCYLVDNNGFVVMSHHKTSDVGKFFGQIDGDILEKLVEHHIYRRVHLFDYQAICLDPEIVSGPSVNPFIFSVVQQMFQMFRSLITWISIVCLNIIHSGSWSFPEYTMAEKNYVRQDNWIESGQAYGQDSTISTGDPLNDNITMARPCDKEFDLYEMIDFSIETKSVEIDCNGGGNSNKPNGNNGQSAKCSRNFSAQYIPHTNLLLILSINNPTCNCEKKKLTIEPKEVQYSDEQRCELLKIEKYRQRPNGCYNYHPQEKEIRQCGKASSLDMLLEKRFFLAIFIIIHALVNLHHHHHLC